MNTPSQTLRAQAETYPGELAMLRGLLGVLRVVAQHDDMAEVRRLLAEHASDEQAAYAEAATTPRDLRPGADAARRMIRDRQETETASPWERAVAGLNALVDADVAFHVEPDGHISGPFGDEHIEWDRDASRWRLVHDDEDEVHPPHPAPCRVPNSPDCTCPVTPEQARLDNAVGLDHPAIDAGAQWQERRTDKPKPVNL